MRRWILAIGLLGLSSSPTHATVTAEGRLDLGVRAYERGDFKRAIQIIRPLLYPSIQLSKQARVLAAHKVLGISYLFEKKIRLASEQFLAILSLRPDYVLDSLVDPNSAVELFERVKQQNAEKIRAILERERKERERKQRSPTTTAMMVEEREVTRRVYWVNFVPLGAGQFQNGHRRKGWLLLGSQVAMAGLSLGTALGGYLGYTGRPLNPDEYDRARALGIVQATSAGICAGLVLYGIIDALVYHEPETVRLRRYRRETRNPEKQSLRLLPRIQIGDGVGLFGVGASF